MKNFNKKQTLMTLGRTALLVAGVFLTSTVYAADWTADVNSEAIARAYEDGRLNDRIDDTEGKLSSEIIRSTNEDTRLEGKIDSVKTNLESQVENEAIARAYEDGRLNDRIDDTEGKLSSEIIRSTNEDTRLEGKIDSETTRAKRAERRLNRAIGNRDINSLNKEINDATRETSLSAGLEAAGNAIGNMAFTGTHYVAGDRDLSSAVRTLDANMNRIENHFNGQINRLENKLDKHHHEMKRGFASLAAMTRLVPNPRACGDTQIAVGVGHYHGSTGVAIGAFHYIDNNTLVNIGVGYSGHDSATFGAGLTFGF